MYTLKIIEEKIVFCIATQNEGKIKHFQHLLGSPVVGVQQDVEETGLTFVENALLKARAACIETGLPSIGDDSGLCVDALNGAPGLYTKRYYADYGLTANQGCEKLIKALNGIENRRCQYVCCLVFLRHANDPNPIVITESCNGLITESLQGFNGFGFDPVFYSVDLGKTFGNSTEDEVASVSHRAKAFKKLLSILKEQNLI